MPNDDSFHCRSISFFLKYRKNLELTMVRNVPFRLVANKPLAFSPQIFNMYCSVQTKSRFNFFFLALHEFFYPPPQIGGVTMLGRRTLQTFYNAYVFLIVIKFWIDLGVSVLPTAHSRSQDVRRRLQIWQTNL